VINGPQIRAARGFLAWDAALSKEAQGKMSGPISFTSYRPSHSASNDSTAIRPTGRMLLCAAITAGLGVAGCASERLSPSVPTPVNSECQQMRDKLATDQTLTPTQAAEITKNMERAGCARRLPGQ
jgi:outer membrane murein-binding lipoprotein Lpp